MKTTLASSHLNAAISSQLSGLKVELSKYRQTKVRPSPAKGVNKLTKSTDKLLITPPKTITNQRISTEPKQQVRTNDTVKLGAQKLCFSTFFGTEETPKLPTPPKATLARARSLTDQSTIEKILNTRAKESSLTERKYKQLPAKISPKTQKPKKKTETRPSLSLLLESSDESQKDSKFFYKFISEPSINEDNGAKGSRFNDCALTTSYITTLPEDDNVSISHIREDIAKMFTSHEDMRSIVDMTKFQGDLQEENNKLRKRVAELEQKNMKWQGFSKLMLAFRTGLKKELKDYKGQNEIDKKTIAALKEQVSSLKATIKTNTRTQQMNDSKSPKRTQESVKALETQMKTIQNDNKKLQSDITFLWEQNKKLRKQQEDVDKYKEAMEHYKKEAEDKFKECSSLAEEIICLRTDLDRLNLKYFKSQKELNKSPPLKDLGVKAMMPLSSFSRKKSIGTPGSEVRSQKKVTIIAPKQKHENNWDVPEDIQTPSPMVFGVIPLDFSR